MPMPASRFLWDHSPFYPTVTPPAPTAWVPGEGWLAGASRGTADGGDAVVPVDLVEQADRQGMFAADFYERWHFSALTFALGNLVGNQTRELRVWNAHRRARVLQDLELVDGEGIIISGQPDPPLQFAPLQQRVYQLEITTEGPPNVEAQLVFDFDEGQATVVLITGSRVTPWLWRPDWTRGILETLEWQTYIEASENENEQVDSMRLSPRRSMTFSVGVQGAERQAMETAIDGWAGRVWSLPVWPDGVDVATNLAAGATDVAVPTAGRDFQPGGLAMFKGEGFRDYEVVEVESLAANLVTLRRPTVRAWPAGTVLYPARTARMPEGMEYQRFTGRTSLGSVAFDFVGDQDWPALTGMPTYRGLPVLEDVPEWTRGPTTATTRKLAARDNGFGAPEYIDRADVALLRQVFGYAPVGRAQLARMRSLLYLLAGRWGAFWAPTWAEDFTLATPSTAGTTALDVDWKGYSLYTPLHRNRRDLRIQQGATVQYARIANTSELDSATERLGIDAPLTASLVPGQVKLSYLSLWRLDTDRLEWAWWSGDHGGDQATAEIPFPMRTFRHDL